MRRMIIMNELMNLRDKRVQTWNAAKAFLESHREIGRASCRERV